MINLTTDRRRIATLCTLSIFLICIAAWGNSVILAQVELSHPSVVYETLPELADEFDVLTRGPLHEAFASAHQSNPESSASIVAAPPALIDEVPPEYKPEGANVQWIPGYWAWDESQHDYIWISGIWRDVPPQRRWMPGYWDQANTGYRWVSGFWVEETQQEVGYLPQPPASIDQGPSTVAPSEEHFYVPGNWQYQNDRYRWATGHWQPMAENWIWIPASYVWTPRGCIYQSGYWDYEFDQRGTCFAPVHFNRPVYSTTNYQYQPSHAINLNVDFLTHLFVRPRCSHYYYGDWYSSKFASLGFQPWVSYRSHYRNYDPLLTYYSCRRSPISNRYNTVQYLAQQHRFYVDNQSYRPRPTFVAQFSFHSNFQKQANHLHHDYVKKSNYVQTYSQYRSSSQRKATRGNDYRHGQQQRSHYHRIQETELRSNRQKIEQLAKVQRDRKQSEVRLAANSADLARRSSADQTRRYRDRTNTSRAAQSKQQAERQRRELEQRRQQQLAQQNQRRKVESDRRTAEAASRDRQRREQQRQTAELARQQRDRRQRVADQTREQARRSQDASRRTQQAQRDATRQAQQRSQQDAARRAKEKAQQESVRRSQQVQRDAARRAQERAQQAQRDAARRAQQKSQQDAARRTQTPGQRQQVERSKFMTDATRRAREAQRSASKARESAQRAQQKAQKDNARRSQQAARERSKKNK